jgi:hypothetical protein
VRARRTIPISIRKHQVRQERKERGGNEEELESIEELVSNTQVLSSNFK